MRSVLTTEQLRRPPEAPGPRRARVVVRRVDPWSVLKFSLLFYFCLMLVGMAALIIVYWALGVMGVIDSVERLLTEVGFGSRQTGFQVNGEWLLARAFVVGLIGVVVWSLVNMLVALLYNLISDIVGGIEVTLGERR
ncbi:MAG TPA: DUF3566 domain-containing protein [Actinomycetota bacterium]|nr:DUF3566 domain-containing protein [Actinomycetota bacterium]